jgi:acid phosphatase
MRTRPLLLFSALALSSFALSGQDQPSRDALNATLWQQQSVEYRAGAIQAWRAAAHALPLALKDKSWTASLEQQALPAKQWKKLPPAIIVDVDETVLDNSPGQARFLTEGDGRYSVKLWQAWTAERRANAVPGAARFLDDARRRGVTVFYVTNRGNDEADATRANLEAQGLPVAGARGGLGDTLLLRGERPDWVSDKSSRRLAVAAHYRIILLGGDDLNDFFPARISPAERLAKALPYEGWWGVRWIILANPMYGSWEDSLLDFDRALSPAQASERKLRLLKQK